MLVIFLVYYFILMSAYSLYGYDIQSFLKFEFFCTLSIVLYNICSGFQLCCVRLLYLKVLLSLLKLMPILDKYKT